MNIIIDTREQTPWTFKGLDCRTSRGKLATGDYSLKGLEDQVSIERKSLSDLLGSITGGRDRFERELVRMRGYPCKCVIVEGRWEDLANGVYRSKVHPNAAMGSIMAFRQRYKVEFLMAGSVDMAERLAHDQMRAFWRSTQAWHQKVGEMIRGNG